MPEGCICHLNVLVIFFDFIECFTTIFLHAHSWLNWVEYIEITYEAPAVWTKDLINFISIYCHHWDCRLGPVCQA